MLELVIFDMEGLMFATEQVNCRAFLEVVKEEGYHPTFEQFTSFLGMNARDIQKKYSLITDVSEPLATAVCNFFSLTAFSSSLNPFFCI